MTGPGALVPPGKGTTVVVTKADFDPEPRADPVTAWRLVITADAEVIPGPAADPDKTEEDE